MQQVIDEALKQYETGLSADEPRFTVGPIARRCTRGPRLNAGR